MTYKKRTKGKITGCLVLKDSYREYRSKTENPVNYKTYCKIIKECNKELLNEVVNESNSILLPYRLGKLEIVKFTKIYREKSIWPVDFKKTKELGFVVYHESKYIYKWMWNRNNAIIINKSKYKFLASREAKRMVAPALKNGVDYFKNK
jgi:hypothetical protein